MPPLPDVPSVLRIEFPFSIYEDLMAKCRVHYRYSGTAPTNTDLNEFCDDIQAGIAADLAPLAGNHVTFLGVQAVDLTSATAAVGANTTTQAGTRGTTLLTADVCALMYMHVNRRYRGGHPRVYWPFGITTDLQTQQEWQDASVVAYESGYGNIDTLITSNGWTGAGSIVMVNVSYYEGFTVVTGPTGRARNVSTPRVTPLVDDVAFFQFRKGIATQRNRLLHLA